jgi:hypothetical protein
MRNPNKVGGGANTNLYGLLFEQTTSLKALFENHPDYEVLGEDIYKGGQKVAELCGKGRIYSGLLKKRGVDYTDINSKKMLPDEAILVKNTVYIIEKKFQNGPGSVDEKLQTCDFKKKQYQKLFNPIGIKVEYIYILNDWFRQTEYRDVHEYILSVGCKYFFNEIPLKEIGL